MDKKTMLKLFGEELLRSLVVLMAILIVGFCAFFVLKIRSDKKLAAENTTEQEATYSDEELQAMLDEENAKDTSVGDAEVSEEVITTEEVSTEEITEEASTEEASTEEVTTEEITTQEQNVSSTDKKILVLNSTKTNGLAS